jgi:hypothetical protein
MKKIFIIISGFVLLLGSGCKKEKLNIVNHNSPTAASLKTEAGITNFSLGIVQTQLGNVLNAGTVNLFVEALMHHSCMGDEEFQPYGNFGIRWSNQVYSVTPPGASAPIINPFGVTQYQSLLGFNSRQAGDRNAFLYEWNWAYNYIAASNQILTSIEDPALSLSGDAATKKALLKAWALWWKGYAYSRLGSMYIGALVVNTAGVTNGDYVTHNAMITEANATLDAAAAALSGITANDDYNTLFTKITASYNAPDNVITPQMWTRIINTMKARNLLVDKKDADKTAADWSAIKALADAGIQADDFVFQQGQTSDGNNDVSGAFFHPYTMHGTATEFTFVSERLIQEFKTGDARLAANFNLEPIGNRYPPNIRSRGLQFGTRWTVINIEDGGKFATNTNQGLLAIAGSYEENELMKAEALINTGNIEAGLAIVDAIRDYQGAGVAAVTGTGLTLAQANAELRRERRVALYLRGTAFYDARRWGRTKPVAQGGGRADGSIYLPASLIGGGATTPDVRPCLMDYSYIDYFDVPLNELDFNAPSAVAAPVKN